MDGTGCPSAETPLQVAAGAGHVRVAEMLIAHGASPFASGGGGQGDESGLMSRVCCPSPVSVAAIHGHRRLLHVMVTQSLSLSKLPPPNTTTTTTATSMALPANAHDHHHTSSKHAQKQKKHKLPMVEANEEEVLSLEEILAEGEYTNISILCT